MNQKMIVSINSVLPKNGLYKISKNKRFINFLDRIRIKRGYNRIKISSLLNSRSSETFFYSWEKNPLFKKWWLFFFMEIAEYYHYSSYFFLPNDDATILFELYDANEIEEFFSFMCYRETYNMVPVFDFDKVIYHTYAFPQRDTEKKRLAVMDFMIFLNENIVEVVTQNELQPQIELDLIPVSINAKNKIFPRSNTAICNILKNRTTDTFFAQWEGIASFEDWHTHFFILTAEFYQLKNFLFLPDDNANSIFNFSSEQFKNLLIYWNIKKKDHLLDIDSIFKNESYNEQKLSVKEFMLSLKTK